MFFLIRFNKLETLSRPMKHKASTQAQPEQYFPASGNFLGKIFSAQKNASRVY